MNTKVPTPAAQRKPHTSKIWIALRFPFLPLDVMHIDFYDNKNVVITYKQRIVCATQMVLRSGVKVGMPISTAHTLLSCRSLERKLEKEEDQINDIIKTLYTISPYIEIYSPKNNGEKGILLEVSRCLLLYQNTQNLIKHIKDILKRINCRYKLGIGHTNISSWLLSFDENHLKQSLEKLSSMPSSPRHFFIKQLKQLSLKLLTEHPNTIDSLEKMGFSSLGDITKQIETQSISTIRNASITIL